MRSHEEYNKDVTTIEQLQFESDKNRQINLQSNFIILNNIKFV